MLRNIVHELKEHAPFTAFGAVTGIAIMLVMTHTGLLAGIYKISHTVFYVLHPAHVVLSAAATTAMYRRHRTGHSLLAALLVGYFGSLGVATLSDSIIPFFLELLLNLPNSEVHIGFIEEPLIVNLSALAGVGIALLWPNTKIPHAGHVLLSTWASLFHILMALTAPVTWLVLVTIFLFLFLAVWVPCCTSDIVFPLLFTGKKHHHH